MTGFENNTFSNLNFVFNKNDDVSKKISINSVDGLKIEYDIDTTNPKSFKIFSGGVNFQDNDNNNTTGLERLALVQNAFQAVELPPDSTTLKINNTLFADDGTNNYHIRTVEDGSEINCTENLHLKINSITAMSINNNQTATFSNLPICSISPTIGSQLVNKDYVDNKTSELHFFDEQFCEGSTVNGLLGFRLSGTGAGSTQMVTAVSHYGIVRVSTPSGINSNTTWITRSPFIWTNIRSVEIVFRPWPSGTATNTTCSVGLLNNTNALDTTVCCLMYSTNVSPINTWNIRTNNLHSASFDTNIFPQLVNVWLKLRIENTDDNGSYSVTLTRMDTDQSETVYGNNVSTNSDFFIGGGVSCVSGATSKRIDFDSFKLRLK